MTLIVPAARLAVLGSPVAHSRSPQLHRAAYAALGLPWSYEYRDVPSGALGPFLADTAGHWRGLSLTMPLKREIQPFLTSTDAQSDRTGSVNTVLFDTAGARGFNTDVFGASEALRRAVPGGVPGCVHILGGGATVTSLIAAALDRGADSVIVRARRPERVRSLPSDRVRVVPLGDDPSLLPAPAVVVSGVPGDADIVHGYDPGRMGSAALVDVAYSPWPTALAAQWSAAGGSVQSGLVMLLHQALGQVRVFVGGDPDAPLPDEELVLTAMGEAVGGDALAAGRGGAVWENAPHAPLADGR